MSNDRADDDPANDTGWEYRSVAGFHGAVPSPSVDELPVRPVASGLCFVSDLAADKCGLLENFSDARASSRAVTPSQKPSTADQPRRTKIEGNKKRYERNLSDPKGNDDDSRISSDICRICHMGNNSSSEDSRSTRGNQNQRHPGMSSQISTVSSCAYLGPLVSACKCRGTVALVHAGCLERWLTESGHTRCELCGYKYATKRVPRHNIFRSVAIWFNTVIVTRQMLLDILYLVVTTPLALFSCYICALALRMLLKNGLRDIPWMIVAMLPTCALTLVAYWGWVITLGRMHGRRWRRYWRNNFVIRLVPDNAIQEERVASSEYLSLENLIEEIDGRATDEIEETSINEPSRDATGESTG